MAMVIAVHEVENVTRWAQAWHQGPGSRHEMMARAGVASVRTFQDPQNANLTGLLLDVSDMAQFRAFMTSDEARQAMVEDGVKPETFRYLIEFTP